MPLFAPLTTLALTQALLHTFKYAIVTTQSKLAIKGLLRQWYSPMHEEGAYTSLLEKIGRGAQTPRWGAVVVL